MISFVAASPPPRTAKEQAHLEKCHARLDTWKVCLMCGGEGQRNETHNFIVRKSNCDHCEGEGMLCSDPLLNTVAKREAAQVKRAAWAAKQHVRVVLPEALQPAYGSTLSIVTGESTTAAELKGTVASVLGVSAGSVVVFVSVNIVIVVVKSNLGMVSSWCVGWLRFLAIS